MKYEEDLKAVASAVAKSVRSYMASETNRRKFEEWYAKTYGKHYKWRKHEEHLV